MLYVSDVARVGFLRILTLMMFLERSSSSSTLTSRIGGGSIRACTSALIQIVCWAIFMNRCIVLEERSIVSSHIVNLKSAVHVSQDILIKN